LVRHTKEKVRLKNFFRQQAKFQAKTTASENKFLFRKHKFIFRLILNKGNAGIFLNKIKPKVYSGFYNYFNNR